MAEEFLQQGGVCGESWWNSPRNLLMSSSPCSLGWASHDELLMEMKSVRSSGDGNSSLLPAAPINSDHWRRNQDLLWRDSGGGSEENDSNFLLDSSMLMKNLSEEQQQPAGFPMSSSSASYSLLQTLFDTDSQSLLHNESTSMNTYPHPVHSNGFLPKPSSTINRLPLTNNALLWNSTPSTTTSPSLTINHNLIHDIHSSAAKKQQQQQREEGKDLATVVKKVSNEPAFKRQRIETPSPLPTFKVRKEKLGDRVTALQQLVSPFGKTDTASVLHEAIEYIKFLHDQVNALSTPYLKYGSPPVQRQKGDKGKDEGVTKDLKGRGLCLVPISSTFPVAAETTTDFWTPSFAGSFS